MYFFTIPISSKRDICIICLDPVQLTQESVWKGQAIPALTYRFSDVKVGPQVRCMPYARSMLNMFTACGCVFVARGLSARYLRAQYWRVAIHSSISFLSSVLIDKYSSTTCVPCCRDSWIDPVYGAFFLHGKNFGWSASMKWMMIY